MEGRIVLFFDTSLIGKREHPSHEIGGLPINLNSQGAGPYPGLILQGNPGHYANLRVSAWGGDWTEGSVSEFKGDISYSRFYVEKDTPAETLARKMVRRATDAHYRPAIAPEAPSPATNAEAEISAGSGDLGPGVAIPQDQVNRETTAAEVGLANTDSPMLEQFAQDSATEENKAPA